MVIAHFSLNLPLLCHRQQNDMNFLTILTIAAGLSMDAFAVSVCKGISIKKPDWKQAVTAGLWFGVFQAAMPLAGYYAGLGFINVISSWDHWIAFFLLFLIGVNMLREGMSDLKKEGDEVKDYDANNSLSFKNMLVCAIATSIDALAVGVSFIAFENIDIWAVAAVIGTVTFAMSVIGILAGSKIGSKFAGKAQIAGGVILIIIGIKILLEHLLGI